MEKPRPRERSVPLYLQLEQIIKSKILTGEFSPGDKIPTETELCDAYQVSKITVRQAVLNLVNEGLLVRKQGKGTFTRENGTKSASTFKFSGNINNLIRDGLKMNEVIPLDITRKGATSKVAKSLNIDEGAQVVEIRRIRNFNKTPVSYIKNYLPLELGKRIKKQDLLTKSMLQILRDKLNIRVTDGIQYIEAIVADYDVSSALSVNLFSPVLYTELIIFTRDKKPVEFAQHFFRPDRFRYTIELKL
jgi:DNA-binding GntR family transcriptional regulator